MRDWYWHKSNQYLVVELFSANLTQRNIKSSTLKMKASLCKNILIRLIKIVSEKKTYTKCEEMLWKCQHQLFIFSNGPTMSAVGKEPNFFSFRGPLLDWLWQIMLHSHWLTQTKCSMHSCSKQPLMKLCVVHCTHVPLVFPCCTKEALSNCRQ